MSPTNGGCLHVDGCVCFNRANVFERQLAELERCDDCVDSPEDIRLPAGYRCYFCDKRFCGPHAKEHFKGDLTSTALAETQTKLAEAQEREDKVLDALAEALGAAATTPVHTDSPAKYVRILAEERDNVQAQISRMVDGGACPRRDPNGECVELNEAIAARDEAQGRAERHGVEREAAIESYEGMRHSWAEEHNALLEAAAREVGYRAALPDPDKLRLLADWFDGDDVEKGRGGSSLATLGGQPPDEVQRELRGWADDIDAALAPAQGKEKE